MFQKVSIILLFVFTFFISNSFANDTIEDKKKYIINFFERNNKLYGGIKSDKIEALPDEEIEKMYNAVLDMEKIKKDFKDGTITKKIQAELQKDREKQKAKELEQKKEQDKIIEQNLNYSKFLEVSNVKIRDFSTFDDGKVPGLDSIKIVNKGDKTVSSITFTFYFKDKSDIIIYEDDLHFFSKRYNSYGFKELKPNYIFNYKQSSVFHPFQNVPEEWQEGNYNYKITEIEFD